MNQRQSAQTDLLCTFNAALLASAITMLLLPAFAQDAFDTNAASDRKTHSAAGQKALQSRQGDKPDSGQRLDSRGTGSAGPENSDSTVLPSVAGAVRVNNLANFEALMNILANGCEIVFSVGGLFMLTTAFRQLFQSLNGSAPKKINWRLLLWGLALIILGLAIPGTLNWFLASARDMSYFS
ncbi:MAG: hypothetical protein K2X27_10575 [Candidatus Obscuribacterales bacterium]|nr:hypothetical protein [Candidatus Obscuribacterales bacterium]